MHLSHHKTWDTYKLRVEKIIMTFSYKISFTGLRLEDSSYKWNEQLYNVIIKHVALKYWLRHTLNLQKIVPFSLIHMLKQIRQSICIYHEIKAKSGASVWLLLPEELLYMCHSQTSRCVYAVFTSAYHLKNIFDCSTY